MSIPQHETTSSDVTEGAAPDMEGTEAAFPSFATMSRASRIAAFTAIRDAIDVRVKHEKSQVAGDLEDATINTSIPTEGLGKLSYKAPTRPVVIDDAKLLAYVKTASPEFVETVTREVVNEKLRARLVADVVAREDGTFALKSTGETIDYASLGAETDARVTWGSSAEQKAAKERARLALDEQLSRLVAPMIEGGAS